MEKGINQHWQWIQQWYFILLFKKELQNENGIFQISATEEMNN